MATGTPGSTARQLPYQCVHYLRKRFTFADNGKTIDIGTLPDGALLIKPISGVMVNQAFNGATTNTLDIGPSTDPGTDLWATVLALGTIGFIPLDEVVTLLVSGDTKVQAKVVSTTGATTGSGVIVIAYIPNNDQ
ncbi:hypothetical protein [Tardiphaga sp. 803_E3_N1_3]|uniref:hypothetical protein n=1 Tax=Tardiphaga sp. 803_E3_N1_3 TaxID=3240785 RepID=UPI003F224A80